MQGFVRAWGLGRRLQAPPRVCYRCYGGISEEPKADNLWLKELKTADVEMEMTF